MGEWSKEGGAPRQPTVMAGKPGLVAVALEDAGESAGQAVQVQAFDIVTYDVEVSGGFFNVAISSYLKGHQNEVTALRMSPDGKYLASGDTRNKIFLWDIQGVPKKVAEMGMHTARIASLDWLPG